MNSSPRTPPSAPGLTLVCFALKEEAGPFRKLVGQRSDIAILLTGIGRKNAEKSVRDFLRTNSPSRVFTCGFAGGLHPDLKVGDVIFSTTEKDLVPSLEQAGAKPAKIFCASRIAITVAEKQQLRANTQADAVEMESETIQIVCREHGIPCATVRVISDSAQEDLPLDFNQLSNADQSLNFGKLALALVKAPGKIAALRVLQRNTNVAANQLATTLQRLVR